MKERIEKFTFRINSIDSGTLLVPLIALWIREEAKRERERERERRREKKDNRRRF